RADEGHSLRADYVRSAPRINLLPATGESERTKAGASCMTIASPALAVPSTYRIDVSWPILILFAALLCVLIILPMSWLFYYSLVNKVFRAVTGASQDEHLFNIYSLAGLIFVISSYTFPYVFVLIANALDRIPGDLEDASAILGARTWTTARRVTIPLALPALLA